MKHIMENEAKRIAEAKRIIDLIDKAESFYASDVNDIVTEDIIRKGLYCKMIEYRT